MNKACRPPELSVILVTDEYATIAPVIAKLRQQTVADRLEVIVVSPDDGEVARALADESAFAALRTVGVPALHPMGVPRTAGIRAATAPYVFVGETHSFLWPEAAGLLLAAAASGKGDVIVPGFENANPEDGVLSWSAFLADYARWSARLPSGEISEAPLYDCIYPRDFLLGLGDRLVPMLSCGDDMARAVRDHGLRVRFEPAARIDHVNMASAREWLHEHYLNGVLIGRRRALSWPWPRRLAYIAASWLIPPVLFWRAWPGIQRIAGKERLPAGTVAAGFLLCIAKAAGEVVGYAGGGNLAQDLAVVHYEIRRLDYVARAA